MRQNNLNNKRGTTLIECVLALAVFTGVSVMIAMMLSTASILQRTTTDTETVLNAVADEAELAITQPVGPVGESDNKGELVFVNEHGDKVASQTVKFVKHTAPVAGSPAAGTQNVTVWRMGIPTVGP